MPGDLEIGESKDLGLPQVLVGEIFQGIELF